MHKSLLKVTNNLCEKIFFYRSDTEQFPGQVMSTSDILHWDIFLPPLGGPETFQNLLEYVVFQYMSGSPFSGRAHRMPKPPELTSFWETVSPLSSASQMAFSQTLSPSTLRTKAIFSLVSAILFFQSWRKL